MDTDLIAKAWLALMGGAGFLAYSKPRVFLEAEQLAGGILAVVSVGLPAWFLLALWRDDVLTPPLLLFVLVALSTGWMAFLRFLAARIQADLMRDQRKRRKARD